MKRKIVVSVLSGLFGSALLFVLLSAAGSVGAALYKADRVNGVEARPDASRVEAISVNTPLSSTFTYQGQLKNGGNAVNGSCQMAFRLYDALSSGNLIGSPIITPVPVTNGLFTVGLNFGNGAFDGNGRWLDIQVDCGGGFTQLTPRQALTPAPYALAFGAPGSVYGYLYDAGSAGLYPTIGFNTYGAPSYRAGVAGYGGVLQFHDEDGSLIYYTGSNVAAGEEHAFTPQLAIQAGGNVGIGTTFPGAKLEVIGEGSSVTSWVFRARSSTGQTGLLVYKDGSVQIGKLLGSSVIHTCLDLGFFASCGSAAEYVPTIDNGAGFANTADLVSIAPSVKNPYDDEHSPFVVTKSATPCDTNLLGFIANPESGADGKKLNDHYLPLAIYGYFPAKVTLENGAIKRGDPLTSSSKPGYAMKATQACKIIGYALEDADEEGTIQVFANHGENAASEVVVLRTQVQELKQTVADLKQVNAALDARLTALEQATSGRTQAQSVPTPVNKRRSQ